MSVNKNRSLLINAKKCSRLCKISKEKWYSLVFSALAPAPIVLAGTMRWRRSDIDCWIWHNCPNRKRFDKLPF